MDRKERIIPSAARDLVALATEQTPEDLEDGTERKWGREKDLVRGSTAETARDLAWGYKTMEILHSVRLYKIEDFQHRA
jgi:hypothetical protein